MEKLKAKKSLPIDSAMPEILDKYKKSPALIVSAEPGTGKTTRLPPALLQDTKKQIWVLEPRRIAAVSAAARIAEENGWSLGCEVGYQVRFENRSNKDTSLLFLTEALLLRKLLHDPELKDVGCVVLDEFHERSLHVDLALGMLKELQELSRPDLKIVVMSATLDIEPLQKFLPNAETVSVKGKIFPLDIRYETSPQVIRTGIDLQERMQKLLARAVRENPEGDILCFLPGRGEIERLRDTFSIANAELLPLHGQLSLAEQRSALEPRLGKRKIILSTNVAESSLTVEGVRVVVDSGLARFADVHARTGFSSMELGRISKASAKQRAGRAARLGPGVVYRAWMPYDELSMKAFDVPEIQRTDLAECVLLLSALGVRNPENFTWFEAPNKIALERARIFLQSLGAIDKNGALTALGEDLREFPLAPRLAKLLLVGKAQGLPALSCELAALLSDNSVRSTSFHSENDLWRRFEDWQRNASQKKYQSLNRARDQLYDLLGTQDGEDKISADKLEEKAVELLFSAFSDRLCRRRRAHEEEAKMASGRGVRLHPDSCVKQSEYFLALELKEGREAHEALVFESVGLPEALVEKEILPRAEASTSLEWDEEKERFWVIERKEWQFLSIGSERRRPANAEESETALANLAFERWDRLLQRNEVLGAWVSRLEFLPKIPFTEVEIKAGLLLACFGENSFRALCEKDLIPYFESQLSAADRAEFARSCPAFWQAPSGSEVRIQYTKEQGPMVELRLQELFGLQSSPKIGNQALTLVLLAPNYRPVQVTRDLASFWQNTYTEVRKELRLRYPKHSWPEDPLQAKPEAKGTRRSNFPSA